MLQLKSSLFVSVALLAVATAGAAIAVTPVMPPSQPSATASHQAVADSDGPTTGGGDTPYLSKQPPKATDPATPPTAVTTPAAKPETSTQAAPAQTVTPAVEPVTPTVPAPPTQAEGKPEPVNPPATTTQAPSAPTTTETSQQAIPPAATPVLPQKSVQAPVQAATPTPVAPSVPQATPVAKAPDAAKPAAKPTQDEARRKAKPPRKPDAIVRDTPRPNTHRAPDDTVTIYDDGPVPPRAIGRSHRYIMESDGPDEGDYVIVRRRPRVCHEVMVGGFLFAHREVRCD